MSATRELPQSWEDLKNAQLKAECESRSLVTSGNKHEKIRRIVQYDKKQRALLPRLIFTYENDPSGLRQLEQINQNYDNKTRDNSANRTEMRYHLEKFNKASATLEADESTQEQEKIAAMQQLSDFMDRYDEPTASTSSSSTEQLAALSSSGDVGRLAAPQSRRRPLHPLSALKSGINAVGKAPHLISRTTVAPQITVSYLFVPTTEAKIRGDGINAIWSKLNNFFPERVLADQSGYHVLFPAGLEGTKSRLTCYEYWQSKKF
jgi:hypothetical protein